MSRRRHIASSGVPIRASALAYASLALPVLADLLGGGGERAALLWLVALAPVLVRARRGGMTGALQALGVAAALFAGVRAAWAVAGAAPAGALALPVFAAVLAAGLGIGWLAERLHRERALASESGADVRLVVDAAGRLRHVSPSFERVLGHAPAEVLGRRLAEFVREADAEALWSVGGATPGDGRPLELSFRHRDGGWRDLEAVARDLLEDRWVAGIVLDCRDATARHRAEAQALLQQRMDASGRLAAGAAHDFNNLLTGLIGHARLLLGKLGPDDPRRGDAEQIQLAVERAAQLVHRLQAFSRQQVLRPEVLDLNAVVWGLDMALRGTVGERVEVATHLVAALGRVKADPRQLEEVLLELAANARDAMPAGGTLEIRTADVELDEEFVRQYAYPVQTGSYVLLSLSDTGEGIPPDVLPHIFEPFFTTKGPGKGTGLGLSSAYGVVKQSGGYIWAESAVGKGTTFRVYLPRVEEQPADAPPLPALDAPAGRTATVLVVEDDEMVRTVVRRTLLEDGYSILEAPNGPDALWIAEDYPHAIDLLLTDIVMPGMSGIDLARRLVAQRADTRVLFMSGHTEEAVQAPSVFGAETAFLPKPFTPEGLSRAIMEVLSASGSTA
ncbi:MAG TPA: ATP-binding protein [Longimicrobiales bacterium]|nr:ATP-binding protein [Longimicrobiales bacterium]